MNQTYFVLRYKDGEPHERKHVHTLGSYDSRGKALMALSDVPAPYCDLLRVEERTREFAGARR